MPFFKSLSIQSKLTVMLLLVSISSIVAIGVIAYRSGKDALTASVLNQLTSVRASKGIQIEAQFGAICSQTSNLANDKMVVDFARRLRTSFDELHDAKIDPAADAKLTAFYRDEFLPRVAKAMNQSPDLADYVPTTPAGRYLQYWYIAANPYPLGQRWRLDDAGDGSAFSAVHAEYQPTLAKLVNDFHFDNLFLVNQESGDVLYTFTKSPLFATNILTGPYSDTTATDLLKQLRRAKDHDAVLVSDFTYFASAMGKPVAVMASPVFDGPRQIAVLFVQLPIDEINRVMTDNFGWVNDGLGTSGECYLVGPDHLMRSRSRLLWEDKDRYFATIEAAGYSREDLDRVHRAGTALLAQPVRTAAVDDAMAGKTSTTVGPDYRGATVLASSAPLDIPGLRWTIVAEMQTDEAFAPLDRLTHRILISSVVIVIVVTLIAVLLGRLFVRPIDRLLAGVRTLEAGGAGVEVDVRSKDEFKDLGAAFNQMSRTLKVKTDLLDGVRRQNDALLLNALPQVAAARFRDDQPRAVDACPDVSILVARFVGLKPLLDGSSPQRSVGLLSDLTAAVDEVADRHGVERLAADGNGYRAVCGLSVPRLDHASRTVDFALEVVRLVQRFGHDHRDPLGVRIGIGSGPAVGGLVGAAKFAYGLWGRAADAAAAIAATAGPTGVGVAQPCYDMVADLYPFGDAITVPVDGGEPVTVRPLGTADSAVTPVPRPRGTHASA